jgi:HK97 family phage portal protein
MSLIKQLTPNNLKFSPQTDSGFNWTRIQTLIHGPGASDVEMTTKNGDGNSAVFACLMAISTAYPEAKLKVYRRITSGGTDELIDSPLQKLLNTPTPDGALTAEEMWFWTAWAKHTDGNAYWVKVRSGNAVTGNVVQLWPVSPALMRPVTRKNSNDFISYYELQVGPNDFENIPIENVIHFKLGIDDKDMRKGISPLKSLARQIATDEEADKFTNILLKNYAVPGLVIIPAVNAPIDKDKADLIRQQFRNKFGGDNRGDVAVMSQGSDIKQFGHSPKEMDISILHRIPEERISAVMGVPAIVAGLGAGLDRATYANFGEAREMFTESKLVPNWRSDAAKINISLKPDFSSEESVYVEHDLTDVRALQEDENEKYKRLALGVSGRWITVNEARSDVGLPPVDGGDELTAPVPEQLRDGREEDDESGDEDGLRRDKGAILHNGRNANGTGYPFRGEWQSYP